MYAVPVTSPEHCFCSNMSASCGCQQSCGNRYAVQVQQQRSPATPRRAEHGLHWRPVGDHCSAPLSIGHTLKVPSSLLTCTACATSLHCVCDGQSVGKEGQRFFLHVSFLFIPVFVGSAAALPVIGKHRGACKVGLAGGRGGGGLGTYTAKSVWFPCVSAMFVTCVGHSSSQQSKEENMGLADTLSLIPFDSRCQQQQHEHLLHLQDGRCERRANLTRGLGSSRRGSSMLTSWGR